MPLELSRSWNSPGSLWMCLRCFPNKCKVFCEPRRRASGFSFTYFLRVTIPSSQARNAAFLLTFSLLVEFIIGGWANISVTVGNNELGAGWCQGCCEYTQGSFLVTCLLFLVNLWAVIKMVYKPPHRLFNPGSDLL